MATSMTSAFGKYVEVGRGFGCGIEDVSCAERGLGMSTTAMKGGVGVPPAAPLVAQPGISKALRIKTKLRWIRCFKRSSGPRDFGVEDFLPQVLFYPLNKKT